MTTEPLGKILIAKTSQGDIVGVGRCIAYCDAPTVTLTDRKGERIHWRLDLCEVIVDVPELAEYLIPIGTENAGG